MRAQTTLDFAVGISIFIVAVSFAVTFVPGMLDPFTAGPQSNTVGADRVATQLSTSTFAEPTNPYVLTEVCTVEFFSTARSGGGTLSSCPATGDSLREWIGLSDRQGVNISIEGDDNANLSTDVERLCFDITRGEIVQESNAGDCDPVFEAGDDPPGSSASVTLARRTMLIPSPGAQKGYDATLEVRVW